MLRAESSLLEGRFLTVLTPDSIVLSSGTQRSIQWFLVVLSPAVREAPLVELRWPNTEVAS